jgi:hypothetical protein
MSHDIDARIKEVCSRIVTEQDSHIFLELVTELNQLLAFKEEKLKNSHRETPAL